MTNEDSVVTKYGIDGKTFPYFTQMEAFVALWEELGEEPEVGHPYYSAKFEKMFASDYMPTACAVVDMARDKFYYDVWDVSEEEANRTFSITCEAEAELGLLLRQWAERNLTKKPFYSKLTEEQKLFVTENDKDDYLAEQAEFLGEV